jgi:DNA-directed RNA polymerase sigma subunit (sigma70/sigma32)
MSDELGISRDMVRALEKRAIRRLRQELRRLSPA